MESSEFLTDDRVRGFAKGVETNRYGEFMLDELEVNAFAVRCIPPNSRVLDVGCGEGDLCAFLQSAKRCQVTGVEPNVARATRASAHGFPVHVGYLNETFCGANGPLDIVLFMDVLEHVPDPVELLTLARRVLSPSGRLIISVPNVAHWTVRVRLLFGLFEYKPTGIMDATHLRWFTAKTIQSVVESAGYVVADSTVSRGDRVNCYRAILPWRFLKEYYRGSIISSLYHAIPRLFGCQQLQYCTAY